ncbi:putative gluconeogenesis factor [Vallitalea longa]|uniref:Putative gluconeogenesis factor n=1 Tax=Vallitalea longa TaxID=2936439 RepID=A0A9W5YAL5_9FIRM|nr:YvcK family protein [Vallitalea longa]GKX30430.1 putative gluconeogenesis factor [Vallitalea longa]
MDNINIVAMGGGTGLSTMLRGLKKYTENLTAVVTVSDNGGSSGILRRELDMLPPGDIRNCILALAETEPIMEKVFQYRFTEGSLSGQNFGNLFLAALNGIFGSFEKAIEKTSEVLAVKGRVLPVTTENVELCALFDDSLIVEGESQIVQRCKNDRKSIKDVWLNPRNPKPYEKVIESIYEADILVLGPGSLFTSIIPNLLVDDMAKAIIKSKPTVIYVSNIMTQPGETDNYNLVDHINVIEKYLGKGIIDYIIVNNQKIPSKILKLYIEDGAVPVKYEKNILSNRGIRVLEAPLLKILSGTTLIRHNSDKLAEVIITILKKLNYPTSCHL